MRHIRFNLSVVVALALVLAIIALPGCSQPVQAGVVGNGDGYAGTLSTAYEDALDVRSQLALGALELEGTADAVTSAQAADLLPLWEALAGNALQGMAERQAVLAQIEATMTTDQITAIAAMQLTGQDAQTWLESQRPAGETTGGQMPQGAGQAPPAGGAGAVQAQPGGSGTAGGASPLLTQAAVALLAERSGATTAEAAPSETEPVAAEPVLTAEPATTEPAATSEPAATTETAAATETAAPSEPAAGNEPASENQPAVQVEAAAASKADSTAQPTTSTVSQVTYVVQAGDTLAAIARAYGVTVQAIVAANALPDANVITVGQELVIPDPAQVPAVSSTASSPTDSAGTAAQRLPGLDQIPDTNPGPPFTVEISANYATQDPVVEKSRTYVVTGVVRNDGDETYAVSDILVTFYDAGGFRGTFSPAIRDGKLVGGEWHWHGETAAEFAALLLAPGEEWPFSVEITAQDMASFLIHPDAAPTGREPAQVKLSDIRLVDEGTGYLRISGTATNASPFGAKNLTVSGVLLDASGQIVSLGSTYVLQQGIEPGASVALELRIEKAPYASYQLYAQAERDW